MSLPDVQPPSFGTWLDVTRIARHIALPTHLDFYSPPSTDLSSSSSSASFFVCDPYEVILCPTPVRIRCTVTTPHPSRGLSLPPERRWESVRHAGTNCNHAHPSACPSRQLEMTFRPDEARVKELFEGALALAPSQRSSFITAAACDDDALRRQVEELLASHEQAKSFLETPAVLGDLVAGTSRAASLGPHHLESRIGAGGMGEVYRGRDTRLNRTVAIKVLPLRVANDPNARERFERRA